MLRKVKIMLVDEIWDFKSINMGRELSIAGEFIYDSAKKAMSLHGLNNNYEINTILYNGAVGIERMQKIYLCLSTPNPTDASTVPECLKKHNHCDLDNHVKVYSTKELSANGRSLLGVFSEYYNNYRYGNYMPGNSDKKLRELFISFLKKLNGKFDFNEPCAAVQFDQFKQFYINELGKIAKHYYKLIDEKAREINTYTYEINSYSNAARVFWSTQRRTLYQQLVLEQEAVKELFGDYSYNEITSKEKLEQVLSYLLRIGDYKQYVEKTIMNNVYMDLKGKKAVFKRTRLVYERNNIFVAIKRFAKKCKPDFEGKVYLETVRCFFSISDENLEKCSSFYTL